MRARDAAGNVSLPSNATTASTAPGGGGGSSKKIVGYFPSWGIYQKAYYVKNAETSGSAAKLTHLNYAFANVVHGVATIYDPWAEYDKPWDAASSVDGVADPSSGTVLRGNFNQLRKLKVLHPQLKIIMSIGGWTLSGGFSAAAATAQSRQTLRCLRRGPVYPWSPAERCYRAGIFDGVDIDWEYPAACGLQCGPPQDTPNFTLLLAELRRQLDLQGAVDGKHYLLSIAAPAGKSEYQKIELNLIHQYLDHINLMTYDFHGSWETVTNFHSPLWMSSSDPTRANGFWADYTVSGYLAAGVPAAKLLLGIPFYGHGWQGVPNFNNGLYQNSAGAARGTYEAGTEDYRVLQNLKSTYGKFRHNEAQAFWIYAGRAGHRDHARRGGRRGDDAEVRRVLEILQRSLATDSRLVVLTRNAVLPESGGADLAGAAVWGLLRSAQQENPDRFLLVDVDDDAVSWRALPAALASGEPQVAIRGGELFAPRLARTAAADPASEPFGAGTVLITGGSGALAGQVARHLVASQGVGRLVLVSRTGGGEALAEALRAEGAQVTLAAADVADRAALASVLAEIPAEHPLTAVVHTAGVLADGIVERMTPDQLDRVLRPKVDGALHLHELTRDLDLSAFVLFSSASAIFGTPGQANYAAANAFLDALAQHRRALGLPGQALAWGPWADGGMAGGLDEADRQRMAQSGVQPFDVESGLAAFDAAVAAPAAQVVPIRLDLAAVRANGEVPPLLRGLVRPLTVRAAAPAAAAVPVTQRLAGRRPKTSAGCCWTWCTATWRRCWATRPTRRSSPPGASSTWASTRSRRSNCATV